MSLKGGMSATELFDTIDEAKKGESKAIAKLEKLVEQGVLPIENPEKFLAECKAEQAKREAKRKAKRLLIIGILLLIVCLVFFCKAFAHKGRTDSNGGHRDNNNQSGLGYYHYHCGGYPAHLHSGGYCPYTSGGYSDSESSSSSHNGYEGNIDYEESYDYGFEKGYEAGYSEGKAEGYDKGYNDGHSDGYETGQEDGYSKCEEEYKTSEEEAVAERKANREKGYSLLAYVVIGIIIIVLIVKFINKRRKK